MDEKLAEREGKEGEDEERVFVIDSSNGQYGERVRAGK